MQFHWNVKSWIGYEPTAMTLIEFVADFQNAQQGFKPLGILNIGNGEYDGQFELLFALPTADNIQPFRIITAVQNVEDYPNSHDYIIFCENDAAPDMADLLQNVRGTERKTVYEFLNIISATLCGSNVVRDEAIANTSLDRAETATVGKAEAVTSDRAESATQDRTESATEDRTESATEDQAESATEDRAESVTADAASGSADGVEDPLVVKDDEANISAEDSSTYKLMDDLLGKDEDMKIIDEDSSEYKDRLLADLRVAREAGFSVGLLGPITDMEYGCYGFFHVAIRMSELGISGEVLQAWEIDPNEYLILIIHYPKGYKTHEELQGFDRQGYDKTAIGMRVVAGKYDRPIMEEAVNAFIKVKGIADYNVNETSTIRDIFISKQLSTLLEESLVPILRFRNTGMDWHGAEAWFSDLQGMDENADPDAIPDRYFEPETTNKVFPDVVTADHFSSNDNSYYSFPLLAMQFVIRHFVRCTEFCLTCHRKLNLELEAIKPQTCERRLCLFRYLNMGLIEHEIIAQPYVVDLLVSFCYSSARACKLKDFPTGLALKVPHVESQPTQYMGPAPAVMTATTSTASGSSSNCVEYNIGFDYNRLEINFVNNSNEPCPVGKDSWIVIKTVNCPGTEYHCRVIEASLHPVVIIDEPIILSDGLWPVSNKIESVKEQLTAPNWAPATMTIYNQNFDKLDKNQRCNVMCKLLDTLPSVKEMQNYLADRHPGDLQGWVQRLSPAALRLFRWIIATNRACIMTVDGDNALFTKQDRLYGMQGYMQFRFAMGAPDKEQRFLREVRNATERLNLQYPTIFAWHGSLLHNWHMIIREGLNFNSTVNGRAYGHGVYHALDATTSEGYSGMHSYGLVSTAAARNVINQFNAARNLQNSLSGNNILQTVNFNLPQNGVNPVPNNVNFQQTIPTLPQNSFNQQTMPSFQQNNVANFPQNNVYLQQNIINPPQNSFIQQNTIFPQNSIGNATASNVNFSPYNAGMPSNVPSSTFNFAVPNGLPAFSISTAQSPMGYAINSLIPSQNNVNVPQNNVNLPSSSTSFPQNSANFPSTSVNLSSNNSNFQPNSISYPQNPVNLSTNSIQSIHSSNNVSVPGFYSNTPPNVYSFPPNNATNSFMNANTASSNVNLTPNSASTPQVKLPPNRAIISVANGNIWPNSVLNISGALALNEIVNAPKEFVSSKPFYVVSQLDWIQTRYLFVKCNPIEGVHIGQEQMPANPHPQDPKRTPRGVSGPIVIPASAIKSGRGLDPPANNIQTLQVPGNVVNHGFGFGATWQPPVASAPFGPMLPGPAPPVAGPAPPLAVPAPPVAVPAPVKKKRGRPPSGTAKKSKKSAQNDTDNVSNG